MTEVTIYTDGACSHNPGPGGWAAILKFGEHVKEISGFEADTTNNRMELLAAINALKALKKSCAVNLYSDSAYLCNAFQKKWIYGWWHNDWVKKDKKPVLNVDLWKELLHLSEVHKITWIKVKGHEDNVDNNRCDEMARGEIVANTK